MSDAFGTVPEDFTMASLLIIDDDIDSADVLAEIMRAQGHEVRVGHDGREGLRLADAARPDVALLDVEMPSLDGPGLANEMLLHNFGLEKVPVIFLSGVTNLSEVAARVGTPYFLNKPYRLDRLLALLDLALVERRAPRPQRPVSRGPGSSPSARQPFAAKGGRQ